MAEVHRQHFIGDSPQGAFTARVEIIHNNDDKQSDTYDLRRALDRIEEWRPSVGYVQPADIMRQVMAQQLEMQIGSFGIDPRFLHGKSRDDYVQAMALALVVEMGEVMQEVSWKPWATGQWFHREAYLEELIDVLHFWMNLVLVATDKPEELLAAYQRKAEVNVKRQETGYTGEKCPECGR